jgi:glycosyltransferase involved in cell wall biosynthesis
MKLISVFMVVYNQEKFIAEAIESVINQELIIMKGLEIVISDDCSTDGTAEILKEYKVKYPDLIKLNINSVNQGITKNSNIALSMCTGEYIAFTAGDDLLAPKRLISQLNWFKKNPDAVLCTSAVEVFFDYSMIVKGPFHDEDCLSNQPVKMIEQYSQLPTARFMINRKRVPNIMYDERTPVVSDWVFFYDIAMSGKVGGTRELGVRYRRHANNITTSGVNNSHLDDRLIAIDILFCKYPQLYSSCKKQRCYNLYAHAKRHYLIYDYKSAKKYSMYAICENFIHGPSYLLLSLSFMGKAGHHISNIIRKIRNSG